MARNSFLLIVAIILAFEYGTLEAARHRQHIPIHLRTLLPIRPTMFVPPDQAAKMCFKDSKSLNDICQERAMTDFSPTKWHTSKSTLWEMCCEVNEELDCYARDGLQVCPKPFYEKVLEYSKEMRQSMRSIACVDPIYANITSWQHFCTDSKFRDSYLKQESNRGKNHSNIIHFPVLNGPEKQCVKHMSDSRGRDELTWCYTATTAKWDPKNLKNLSNPTEESCCAFYQIMDCLLDEAKQICTGQEYRDMESFYQKAIRAYGNTPLCRSMPYNNTVKAACDKLVKPVNLTKKPGNAAQHAKHATSLLFALLPLVVLGLLF